jgi:hypothetical protein
LALTALTAALNPALAAARIPEEPAPRTVEFDTFKKPAPYLQQAPIPQPQAPPPPTATTETPQPPPPLKPRPVRGAPPRPEPATKPTGELTPTDTERWVLDELRANRAADLSQRSDKQLRAAFVSALLNGTPSSEIGPAGVRIAHAVIIGDLQLGLAPIAFTVSLEKVELSGGIAGNEAQINGAFKLTASKVNGPVMLEAARITGPLELQDAVFRENVSLSGIDVQGPLFLDRTQFENGFNIKNGSVAGTLQAFETKFLCATFCKAHDESASFYGANVAGDVFLSRVKCDGPIQAARLHVERNLVLDHGAYRGFADFAAGVVGEYLVIDSPRFGDGVRLAQLRYGSISNGEAKFNAESTWEDLKELYASCEFSSDIYSKLEEFFASSGDQAIADDVYIEQKTQERRKLTMLPLLLNHLMYWSIGYGRHAIRALWWGLLFVGIGSVIFKEDDMVRKDDAPAALQYNRAWYSLDVFLPLTRLYAADWWTPKRERKLAWFYLRIHHLLGWVLIPLGLAAVSGIIK